MDHVKQDDFEQKVLEVSKTKPVAVDFWAAWCGPCKALGPIFEETAGEYGDKAQFAKINVDEEPALSQQFGVMSIPTIVYFKDGKPASQSVGLVDKSEIKSHLDQLM